MGSFHAMYQSARNLWRYQTPPSPLRSLSGLISSALLLFARSILMLSSCYKASMAACSHQRNGLTIYPLFTSDTFSPVPLKISVCRVLLFGQERLLPSPSHPTPLSGSIHSWWKLSRLPLLLCLGTQDAAFPLERIRPYGCLTTATFTCSQYSS